MRRFRAPVLLLDANGHISRTTWPAAKKNTFNGQCLGELLRDHHLQAANTFFPWERISLDPSPILRSTLRVFWPLSTFTDVVHCTTTEIGHNWQQPRGEGIIAPFSVSFSISLQTEYTKKGKITNGTRTSLHTVPSAHKTGPPFCHG